MSKFEPRDMQSDDRRKKPSWWWLLAGVPVLLSFYLPSAREMHVMSLRLLGHMRGETEVQGDHGGCILYHIPNVNFTEKHLEELKARAAESPETYLLASTGYGNERIPAPPLGSWTNGPFATWGAFHLTQMVTAYSDSTNLAIGLEDVALQLVGREEVRNPTNGALWLAEAAIHFNRKDDAAALAALTTAASNKVWRGETEKAFTNIAGLFERAGFSRLDAATKANLLLPSIWVLQGDIRRGLCRMMEAAVRRHDDVGFNRLFKTLVELRTANWDEKSEEYAAPFRSFYISDEFASAMGERLAGPNTSGSSTDRSANYGLFLNYIEKFVEPVAAARFHGQGDGNATLRSMRSQLVTLRTSTQLKVWAVASVAGMAGILLLAVVLVIILLEIPFSWLARRPAILGLWPRGFKFWMISLGVLMLAVWGFTDAQLSLGLNARGGLQIVTEPEPMSETTESFIVSLMLCLTIFAGLLVSRRMDSARTQVRLLIVSVFAVYCTLMIVAGIFRERTVEIIQSGLF